jgi:hypothetical protein
MPAQRTLMEPEESDRRYVRRNVSAKGQSNHGDRKKRKAKS